MKPELTLPADRFCWYETNAGLMGANCAACAEPPVAPETSSACVTAIMPLQEQVSNTETKTSDASFVFMVTSVMRAGQRQPALVIEPKRLRNYIVTINKIESGDLNNFSIIRVNGGRIYKA